jgi:hypothetical protein
MFQGISKGRLVFWGFLWATLFVACGQMGSLLTQLLAVAFLIGAVIYAWATYRKFKRDASYRMLSNQTFPPVEPDPSPKGCT